MYRISILFLIINFIFLPFTFKNITSLKYSGSYLINEVDASFIGESANDHSGYSISIIGDVNKDGYDDILIGAHLYSEEGSFRGKSYLIWGKSTGWSFDFNLSSVNHTYIGESSHDYSGASVSGIGDINNDGFSDFAISSYLNDEGGRDAGKIYLFFGKLSGWEKDNNRLTFANSFF